jgi:hypothetical protein
VWGKYQLMRSKRVLQPAPSGPFPAPSCVASTEKNSGTPWPLTKSMWARALTYLLQTCAGRRVAAFRGHQPLMTKAGPRRSGTPMQGQLRVCVRTSSSESMNVQVRRLWPALTTAACCEPSPDPTVRTLLEAASVIGGGEGDDFASHGCPGACLHPVHMHTHACRLLMDTCTQAKAWRR